MKRQRHEDDRGGKDEEDDLSSSQSSEDSDTGRRKRSKDKKRKKHRESSQSRKKHKKHKSDRRHRHDDSSESDSSSRERRKKRKKEKRKRKKSERRSQGSRHRDGNSSGDDSSTSAPGKEKQKSLDLELERNHRLASALCSLLEVRPVFVSELPLMLIRMAGGASFDLSQMTDAAASNGLEAVFESLSSFGVQKNRETQSWMFQAAPSGTGGRVNRDELVLLRLVRALLNDLGFTMEAIKSYESKQESDLSNTRNVHQLVDKETIQPNGSQDDEEIQTIGELTRSLLVKFDESGATLADELRGLCTSIAQGECISLEGLPDKKLEKALESLFTLCGLELSEMDKDDDSDDEASGDGDRDDDDEAVMGFSLPENGNDAAQVRLAAIMKACRSEVPSKSRAMMPARGPLRKEDAEDYNQPSVQNGSSDDDEGPAPFGATARRHRGPAMHPDLVKAQADRRQMELEAATSGVTLPPSKEGEREEWMLVPGKHDFLSSIKAGQPIKGRGFQNKKSGGGDKPDAPVHPAIQAEIDAIMDAHSSARGPSLIDQHRAKKEEERQSKSGKPAEWKWSRDKDLDAGRRVDKDALAMVLGGAADNLKDKFQRSLHR